MENLIYEMIEATEHLDGYVRLTDANGCIYCIPLDPANSDYQAYLNKDKPKVEHLTEIPTE
jgi:hypothetical protein